MSVNPTWIGAVVPLASLVGMAVGRAADRSHDLFQRALHSSREASTAVDATAHPPSAIDTHPAAPAFTPWGSRMQGWIERLQQFLSQQGRSDHVELTLDGYGALQVESDTPETATLVQEWLEQNPDQKEELAEIASGLRLAATSPRTSAEGHRMGSSYRDSRRDTLRIHAAPHDATWRWASSSPA